MLPLTKQERTALVFLAAVILLGTVLQIVVKKFPAAARMLDFMNGEQLKRKVDINAASPDDLNGIPYVGPAMAREIFNYRQTHGRFENIEDLKKIKGIGPRRYERIAPHVLVIGNSTSPAAVAQ